MKMLLALLVSLVPVVCAAPAVAQSAAGVAFEMTTTEGSSTEALTTTMSAQGRNLRMTVQSSGTEQPGEMIFRGDRQEMIMIDHQRRNYMVMDRASIATLTSQLSEAMRQMEAAMANVPEAQREMMERMIRDQMPGAQAPPPAPEVRATGERSNHAGFATVRYDVSVGGTKTQELWVTEWSNVEGADEIRPAFEAMSEFTREFIAALASGPLGGMINIDENGYQLTDEVNGFPVVTRNLAPDGGVVTETTLRSATRTSFDAAHFEAPADYSRQEMPQ